MNLTFFTLGGFPPGGRVLPFVMQHQLQSQWCWAATSASVSVYFNPSSKWTQCLIVNSALHQTTCCIQGSSSSCNRPWFLDDALRIVGNLGSTAPRRAPLNEVTQEIDSNRPICLRIGWNNGGGHFVAIYGYAGTIVNVGDPWWGDSAVEYATFPDTYQGGGKWTHTYWVVP